MHIDFALPVDHDLIKGYEAWKVGACMTTWVTCPHGSHDYMGHMTTWPHQGLPGMEGRLIHDYMGHMTIWPHQGLPGMEGRSALLCATASGLHACYSLPLCYGRAACVLQPVCCVQTASGLHVCYSLPCVCYSLSAVCKRHQGCMCATACPMFATARLLCAMAQGCAPVAASAPAPAPLLVEV